MVRHHGRGEGVAGGGDQNAGELWVKEVGVLGDRGVEAGLAEGEQGRVLGWGGLGRGLVRGVLRKGRGR